MPEEKIADLFRIQKRFLKSAHLERDFYDPTGLDDYVVTDFSQSCLRRLTDGLAPGSGQRAWRLTGDYGSGKSSFALLLAHFFAGHDSNLPPQIRKVLDSHKPGTRRPPRFIPVLVTCSRQFLGKSILEGLHQTLKEVYKRGAKTKIAAQIQRLLDADREPTDDQVLQAISDVNTRIIADSKGQGLFLILDELGKFLEYASLHPELQDVFFLQQLAETASRSKDEPLFVVGILHQGFNAYANHLSQPAQREWEKVAGRFEEILFNQPVEQLGHLIASATNVAVERIPKKQSNRLKNAIHQTLSLGWYGSTRIDDPHDFSNRLFPLHPTVLPVLIRTFRRFGQNERSLFSFLLSNEPFGLRSFAESMRPDGELFRLHDFYDYMRTNFGHRLAAQSYRSHWSLIDSIVETFATADELDIKILKTVGILNLLNEGDLLPTEELIACALADAAPDDQKGVRTALKKLRHGKRVLFDRGRARGLCLWPHTSVDLEKAYEDARRAVDTPKKVGNHIKDYLESRPIVARRHYIETGNLRHFEVRYCAVSQLTALLEENPTRADGRIIVPLCETPEERNLAAEFGKLPELKDRPNWLLAIPQPLNHLSSLVQEVERWEWISRNAVELNGDKFAREEVSRQTAAARSQLEKRIQYYIGFKQVGGQMSLEWYLQGNPLPIHDGRQLLSELSRIFDDVYSLAPRIHNELINRRVLSSAAAAAQMRLIERMLANPNDQFLGMDARKRPPEMSMYFSVLRNSGLHRKREGVWSIREPHHKTDTQCCVLPSLWRIRDIVLDKPDARVNVAVLFEELRKPPYGVRDGMLPLLLAVFAITHDKEVVFYKDGTFLRELDGGTMLVLSKATERFDIQFCKIEGVRAVLFDRLIEVLSLRLTEKDDLELIDVVKALCRFVAQLPAYVLNTKKLTPAARSVRDTVLNAREPATLLFTDLPRACGFDPMTPQSVNRKLVESFVNRLKAALDDLRSAYPGLHERLQERVQETFELPKAGQPFRAALAARAEKILLNVTEPGLRAFCLRLMDDNLPESEWLESLGSLLALKPPSKWSDAEEDTFENELAQIASRFQRVENLVFAGSDCGNATGIRLAITHADGSECTKVVHFTTNEERRIKALQKQFRTLLSKDRRLGLAAVSRAIWSALQAENNHES